VRHVALSVGSVSCHTCTAVNDIDRVGSDVSRQRGAAASKIGTSWATLTEQLPSSKWLTLAWRHAETHTASDYLETHRVTWWCWRNVPVCLGLAGWLKEIVSLVQIFDNSPQFLYRLNGNRTTRRQTNSRSDNSRTGQLADWSTRGLDNSRKHWSTRGRALDNSRTFN